MKEFDLYEPMNIWLNDYLSDKYKGWNIYTTYASHKVSLDKILEKYNIHCPLAIGIDIQIDILGIVKKNHEFKLFFIEAKKGSLTLRDLGQLWSYCKLINPEEAFLFSAQDLGSLNKILNVWNRIDLLKFGDNKQIKNMQIAVWDSFTQTPRFF